MHHEAKITIRIILSVIFGIAMVSYAIFESRRIVEGPKILIESPTNGQTVGSSLVVIKGNASNINSISLNDRPIFIDEQGYFSEKLLAYPGYNIMRLDAKDKFGQKTTKTLEIIYSPQGENTPNQQTTNS